MLVWVFAVLFAMVFAALGYGSGAIRMVVALIGTVLSVILMGPLGRLMQGIGNAAGADNMALREGLPGFLAFVLVWLVVYGVGFAVHNPLVLHFKYKEDDATRESFNRMNQAGGCVLGILIGMIVFFTAGKRVYAGGYLTAQTTGEGTKEPALVKLGTSLRRSAAGTGWERTFGALDETPARFYEVSDVLGLLYENPAVLEYLRDYPPFYALEDKQEFVDMAADTEFMDLLKNKEGFSPVVNHPKIKALLANPDLTAALLAVDLADFTAWVKTGTSPKYADERILGRWRVDVANVLLSIRRGRGNIPPAEFAAMRAVLTASLSPLRLKFFPDGRFTVVAAGGAAPANPEAGAEGATADGAAAGGGTVAGMDPRLAQRYGMGAGRPAAAAGTAPAPAAAGPAPKAPPIKLELAGEGQWLRNPDGKYTLTHPGLSRAGKVEAAFNDLGRLVIPLPEAKGSLVLLPSN